MNDRHVLRDTPELLATDIKRAINAGHTFEQWERYEPEFSRRYTSISEEIQRAHESVDPVAQDAYDEAGKSYPVIVGCEKRLILVGAVFLFSVYAELGLVTDQLASMNISLLGIAISGLDGVDLTIAALLVILGLNLIRSWHICRQRVLPVETANAMYQKLSRQYDNLQIVFEALMDYGKPFGFEDLETRYSFQNELDKFRAQTNRQKSTVARIERGCLALSAVGISIWVFKNAASFMNPELSYLHAMMFIVLLALIVLPGIVSGIYLRTDS